MARKQSIIRVYTSRTPRSVGGVLVKTKEAEIPWRTSGCPPSEDSLDRGIFCRRKRLRQPEAVRFGLVYAAVDLAVANGANIVSMSWGGGEASNESTTDFHFNVPNVVMVTSSGDGGHGAQYPAASPYVVAIGGTSLTINASTGAYVSETSWSGSGGGTSSFEPEPTYQGGVQSTGKRGIPDVAYDADPNTGVPAYNSYSCGGACFTGWLNSTSICGRS
jgi:hypothetical protein